MKDRFTLGFIAGVIGSIPLNAMSLFNYYVSHFVKLRYLDYAGYMIFGRLPKSIGEVVLSQIVQIGFSGALGAIFAYFILLVSEKYYWFKGIVWGSGSWFVIYSLEVLAKIPALSRPTLGTASWQFVSTSIYGLVTAYTFIWLERRTTTPHTEQNVLRKYRVVPEPARKIDRDKKKIRVVKPYKIK